MNEGLEAIMTIQASTLNESFGAALAVHDGCSTLAQCFTCGACSGVCPVEKVVDAFDPRKIVHMVALGMEEELMTSDIIWACSQCQSCVPVCPQGVRCSDVIKGLRDEAVSRGFAGMERLKGLGLFAEVDAGKCVACLTCVRLCPFGAPGIVSEGYAFIDPDKCKACGICVLECPAQAISLSPSQEYRGMMEGRDV
jgi:heterodisulfide reductase subunit C